MAKGGFGSITCVPFWKGCCGLCTWPIVTLCLAGIEVGDKYKIGEGKLTICFKTCCCFCCYVCQIQNEVMVREKLSYGMMTLVPDGGAPSMEEMQR